jgi:hypothetical protein
MVKTRTQVDIPPAYAEAKVASLQQLVELINDRYAGVRTLSVSELQVEFQGGAQEEGYWEKYPKGKGVLLARGPDSIYVNVLNPLTSSTVVTMASTGLTFQIWLPRENKFFMGKTSVQLNNENPFLNVRPHHILSGLLIERIPVADVSHLIFLEEAQDAHFKYYVVGVLTVGGSSSTAQLVRKLWIERSELRLVRQQYFGNEGAILTDIRYNHPVELAGFVVSAGIEITRPTERYSVEFELEEEKLRVNQPLREEVFELSRPSGSELVIVEEEPSER